MGNSSSIDIWGFVVNIFVLKIKLLFQKYERCIRKQFVLGTFQYDFDRTKRATYKINVVNELNEEKKRKIVNLSSSKKLYTLN